jgi:hypothetical protein
MMLPFSFEKTQTGESKVARTDHDVNASFDTIGAFWPYGKPDQKFTGSLSCDKGRLLLKSAPVYSAGDLGDSASDFFLSLNSTEDQPRVESVIGYVRRWMHASFTFASQ